MKNITFLLSLLIACAGTSAQETRPETDREVVLADYMQAKGQAEIVGLWEILEHEVVWKLGGDSFADKKSPVLWNRRPGTSSSGAADCNGSVSHRTHRA